jgi:hypothetical protein
MDKEELKRITKEALKEWMDEKFLSFGKWSFGLFSAAVFMAVVYFVLKINGWTNGAQQIESTRRMAPEN